MSPWRLWDIVAGLLRRLPQPLGRIRSIKLKLAILLVGSGGAGFTVFVLSIGWLPPWTVFTALTVSLVMSQVLAHGTTAPLRAMTAAARTMSRGDYSQRVPATSRDEVGELARAFNRMAADLETADRQRRELIANVSHELRTPITALQAVLENLVDGLAEPDPATLKVALGQTERLSRLVTELLDLSRLDAGVEPLRRSPVKLEPFLTAAAEAAAVGVSQAHIEVDVLPSDLEINADEARLHQVVANLLDNAARHSPPGGRVLIRARGLPSLGAQRPGTGLLLEVTDEGPGIPPEERTRVFDRFSRGSTPAIARDGGTGLGLAIARWAVELHDGTISVADTGPGCRIQVTLPA
ncbi:HAMP domain-containing sensor histidine kinase [Cryptosporangium aurantiacum]|uniref:Signal transduction histidine-protein kinase/phosphatase MprB n=1 Tax=Cryptosporangium aurantiacum TaxID=134849 RepID=A0A1M7IUX5_9ACTN|nr:HAMP domain-containing sensor histidine kinase [Cryptosporangium aurantiacum]SHM44147.1 His Kinase A (phospho-acceptor) domain-containing protein [Cryptosporangium aurantiacum]